MTVTAAEVMERVFTTPNPKTGSSPPAAIAWAVFANGTCFFSAPTAELPIDATHEAIADAARAALRALGAVHAGSPSADFNPVRLDGWFPDEAVWFVGFDHPAIATIVVADAKPLVAGIQGRGLREADHDAPVIVTVRGFDGRSSAPPVSTSG